MKEFSAIFEVWANNSIQYMMVEIGGNVIPKQTDLDARVSIVEYMNENMDYMTTRDETTNEVIEGITVLDLIGVYVGEEKIWHEVAK